MTTLAPERLDEVAAGWRRGLDVDDLVNPAGSLFGEDEFTPYEITMTGGAFTECTIITESWNNFQYMCVCCRNY